MFIELIETLRCPRPHEDSWLVGAFDELVERDVRTGRLGCPICRAEYPIVEGVVWFDAEHRPPAAGSSASPPRAGESSTSLPAASAEDALRLAAMLDLSTPGGIVVLEGEWGVAARMLAGFVDSRFLLLNAPAGLAEREGLSAVVCRDTIPVVASSCRAIALHKIDAARRLAEPVARALRPLGRLVLPAGADVPDGFTQLARDAAWSVAERVAPPPSLVALERGRRA